MIISKNDDSCFAKCVEALQQAKVIIIPTDTIYGLSGIVPETEQLIFDIKRRPPEKKMIRLIAHPEDVYKYTDQIIPKAFFKKWPGALTLVVKAKHENTTIAFRCPDNEWLTQLIDAVGKPIYSSSANISNHRQPETISEIKRIFEKKVALIVDDGDKKGLASTVVDLTYDQPLILRRGSVAI